MFDCPNCGEPVRDDSSFCPHCGSDAETGWNPEADYYSLELPETGEDDDEYECEEYGDGGGDASGRDLEEIFRGGLGGTFGGILGEGPSVARRSGGAGEHAMPLRSIVGPGLTVLCLVLFVSIGYRRYGLWVTLPAIFLMAMTLLSLSAGRHDAR